MAQIREQDPEFLRSFVHKHFKPGTLYKLQRDKYRVPEEYEHFLVVRVDDDLKKNDTMHVLFLNNHGVVKGLLFMNTRHWFNAFEKVFHESWILEYEDPSHRVFTSTSETS